MHMADALLSPAVGGVMTVVSLSLVGLSVNKLAGDKLDEQKIPMMGVMGALLFAAQMVNFSIPGTGSSGHISGGILLTALLGPFPALLTFASVLLIQCLFFADGGLLAYGCNLFNMGVLTCLIVYPLVYQPIVKRMGIGQKSITIASISSVVVALQLGAFAVVLQTVASGSTALPFRTFLLFMQPIHLAIGLIEGLVTASVLCFVYRMRPELLEDGAPSHPGDASGLRPDRKVFVTIALITVIIASGLSLFASANPDGLEWSIAKTSNTTQLERESPVHDSTGALIDSTALLPDYTFAEQEHSSAGTATAGIVGSLIVVVFTGTIGFIISTFKKSRLKKKWTRSTK